ncbi:FtsW/RodA/SpoVE family cell cycle protein [Saccharibacillus sacchari]|uniref:FtsW/RodA/SpoVE family cell cycle protein n=1 Tax=Saccharibacillus sacchari TaxID=456493 RepID=A0ACC6P7G4_9BACL
MSGEKSMKPKNEQPAAKRAESSSKADPLIEEYLDRVCARIRAKELHPELREEIRGHIEELMAEKEEEGLSPVEAATWALTQMGDADEVGGTLGQVHRPKLNWRLLIPLAVMMAFALLALFSLAATGEGVYSQFNPGTRQLFFYALGWVALIVCIFVDYRIFKKHALGLYAFTVVSTVLLLESPFVMSLNGNMNWVLVGPFTIDVSVYMFVLFVLALPGVLERLLLQNKKRTNLRQLLAVGAIVLPVLLYVFFDLLNWLMLAAYLIAAFTLYIRSGGSRLYIYGLSAAAFAWMAGLYVYVDHWQARVQSVFAPQLQNDANNYLNDSIGHAVRNAGWFGKGFGQSGNLLVYAHAESMLPYLTYSFGWVAAGLLVASIVGLIILLLRTVRKIGDAYGRLLATGLSILLACQLIYGIGASFNLLPFTTLSLPFMGYGGFSTMIHFAIFGLILGIYRRKDMIPTRATRLPEADNRLIFRIGGFELYANRGKR